MKNTNLAGSVGTYNHSIDPRFSGSTFRDNTYPVSYTNVKPSRVPLWRKQLATQRSKKRLIKHVYPDGTVKWTV